MVMSSEQWRDVPVYEGLYMRWFCVEGCSL